MAAGLSIEEKNIEEFRRRLNVNCTLTDEELRPKIVIDVPMPVSYITKGLVEQISLLEPFGKGNTKPVFAQKNLRVLDHSIIGKNKNVVKLKLLDPQGISVEGIYFGEAEDFVNFIREKTVFLLLIIRRSTDSGDERVFRSLFRITVNIITCFVSAGKSGNTNVRA